MLRWKKARTKGDTGEVPNLAEEEASGLPNLADIDTSNLPGFADHEAGDLPGLSDRMANISFHRAGADWEGFFEQPDGTRVQILVEDVDGEPNPEFVPVISGILEDLDALETSARIGEAELALRLTSEHRLTLICETHPKAEFALGFASGLEMVIVDFRDGEVFSWCFLQEPAADLALTS